jgi:IS5 family transposase
MSKKRLKNMSFYQPMLFPQSTRVKITLSESHELFKLSQLINWTALIALVEAIRETKVQKSTGPKPRYRALIGALVLMAMRKMTYREAEDQIAYYAPARYLCDLMDSDMTLDHVTIFEFTQMLGPVGVKQINEAVLKAAVDHGLLDPSVLMSDTTAQEAMIPYPNEVGLMARYMELAKGAISRLGGKFNGIKGKIKETAEKVKGMVRNSHLFAKTKEEKGKVGRKIYHTVKEIQKEIDSLLESGHSLSSKTGKQLIELSGVMSDLMPQIWHFFKTGFVASKKIIHLQIPELYAIVRGKAGKKVEFGLKWGISRIGSGFVQGFLLTEFQNGSDQSFCIEALNQHKAIFGKAPETYGFDRGGYSKANIKRAKKLGVKNVGIAPKGKAGWAVSSKKEKEIKRERARVEGAIGTLKSSLYGFNKPSARSSSAMVRYGQTAILGFNMRKMIREAEVMVAI